MADRKISALTALVGADVVAADDYIPIIDASVADASKNKRILIEELRKALVAPSFSAHKNGSNQTGVADSTATQITFGTEAYDVGGYFASNAWTPPPGKVNMHASFYASGTITAGALGAIYIYKDGSPYKQRNDTAVTGSVMCSISVDDVANGSNVYTVFGYVDVASGTATFNGGADLTYFQGKVFSG